MSSMSYSYRSSTDKKDVEWTHFCGHVCSLGGAIIAGLAIGVPWAVRFDSSVGSNSVHGDLSLSLTRICGWNRTMTGKFNGQGVCADTIWVDECSLCGWNPATCGSSPSSDWISSEDILPDWGDVLAPPPSLCSGLQTALILSCMLLVCCLWAFYLSWRLFCARASDGIFPDALNNNPYREATCGRCCKLACFRMTVAGTHYYPTARWTMGACIGVLLVSQTASLISFARTLAEFNIFMRATCAGPGRPPWWTVMCFARTDDLKVEAGWGMVIGGTFACCLGWLCSLCASRESWKKRQRYAAAAALFAARAIADVAAASGTGATVAAEQHHIRPRMDKEVELEEIASATATATATATPQPLSPTEFDKPI